MVYDKTHIALVDPHAEGYSRHDDLDVPYEQKASSVTAGSCCAREMECGLLQMKPDEGRHRALPLLHWIWTPSRVAGSMSAW